MAFNSYVFILLFLPAFLLLYFISGKFGKNCGKWVIILAGAVFYAYSGMENTAVLAFSMVINLVMIMLLRKTADTKIKKSVLIAAVILNVLLLLYYKYFNFLANIVNSSSGLRIKNRELILPAGISFLTFRQIMYIVSVWKGESDGSNLLDYFSYILFFPKIIMGPLMEPAGFISQLNDPEKRKADPKNIAGGLKLFSIGLFKKVILADTFAKAADLGFTGDISGTSSGNLILIMLSFTFQIYFDFSGYSDMAAGAAKMINIILPMNFDTPYKAFSIRSFWKRWHISLTDFLTNYIYIPLGGSRKGQMRTIANILTVYLVSGLWHGANRTFILWGLIHGVLQIIERLCKKPINKVPRIFRWICTFFSVNILWLLFRAESIDQWRYMITRMFRFDDMSVSQELIDCFVLPEQSLIFDALHLNQLNSRITGFGMIIFIAAAFIISLVPESAYKRSEKLNLFNMVLCAVLFVWGFLCLSAESVFLYTNF